MALTLRHRVAKLVKIVIETGTSEPHPVTAGMLIKEILLTLMVCDCLSDQIKFAVYHLIF